MTYQNVLYLFVTSIINAIDHAMITLIMTRIRRQLNRLHLCSIIDAKIKNIYIIQISNSFINLILFLVPK